MPHRKTRWILGPDQVTEAIATKFWAARDRLRISETRIPGTTRKTTTIHFDDCVYYPEYCTGGEHSETAAHIETPDELIMAITRLDPLSKTWEAILACLYVRKVEGGCTLPDRITRDPGPPAKIPVGGMLGRIFRRTRDGEPEDRTVTDPLLIARLIAGRVLHREILDNRAHPTWGKTGFRVGRHAEVVMTGGPLVYTGYQPWRPHVDWWGPIREAVEMNQRTDIRWIRASERAKAA